MIKNIAKILTSHIIVKTIGLANIAFVVFFLSIKDFGDYSYLFLMLNLVAIIIDPFLSAYLIDSKTFDFNKYNFGIIIIGLVLSPFFYFLVKIINNNLSILLFVLFTGTYFFSAILKSYLNLKERYINYGLIDITRQLIIFCTTIFYFFILKSDNYLKLLELNYLVSFLAMIILSLIFLKRNEIEFNFNISNFKKLTSASKYFIFYTAIIPLFSFIDSFFVDSYLTEEDLGIYSFSLKIYNISLMLVLPIFTVLNIKQIEIAKENNYLVFVQNKFKKVFVFSTIIFISAIFFNWIITSFIYLEYKSSFWISNILMFGSYVTYLTLPFSFLIAYRKYKHLFFLGIIAILVNIVINYFFIKKNGIFIVAFSTLFSQLIINLGAAIFSYFLLSNNKNEN